MFKPTIFVDLDCLRYGLKGFQIDAAYFESESQSETEFKNVIHLMKLFIDHDRTHISMKFWVNHFYMGPKPFQQIHQAFFF